MIFDPEMLAGIAAIQSIDPATLTPEQRDAVQKAIDSIARVQQSALDTMHDNPLVESKGWFVGAECRACNGIDYTRRDEGPQCLGCGRVEPIDPEWTAEYEYGPYGMTKVER